MSNRVFTGCCAHAGTLTRDFKHTQLDFEQYIDQKETEEDEEEAPKVLCPAHRSVVGAARQQCADTA